METTKDLILRIITILSKDNKVCTYKDIETYLKNKLSLSSIRYHVKQLERTNKISIIYPGLGMSRRAEQYIYSK